MNIEKYAHACFVATKNNDSVVVDPGELTPDFIVPEHPIAVIVTHVHPDHWSKEHLQAIVEKNNEVQIFAPEDATAALQRAGIDATAVSAGEIKNVGDFTLSFTGGEHAVIHPMQDMCQNIGVSIDDGELYYPGDSFAKPAGPVKLLAIPIAAPWMKLAEAIDYLMEIKPTEAFPTHDAVLSDAGRMFHDNWMQRAAEQVGTNYLRS